MTSPLLDCAYLHSWHLRAPPERERWQKDGWPRYFRTQLLLLLQSTNTGLHKDRGGLWDRREGKPLAQLLIWYSRLVRKGRWSSTPHLHPCTHTKYFSPMQAHNHTHATYVIAQIFFLRDAAPCWCWVHCCVWKTHQQHLFSWFCRLHVDPPESVTYWLCPPLYKLILHVSRSAHYCNHLLTIHLWCLPFNLILLFLKVVVAFIYYITIN